MDHPPLSQAHSFESVIGQGEVRGKIGLRRVALCGGAMGWSVAAALNGYSVATLLGLAIFADALIPRRTPGWSSRSLPFLAAGAAIAPFPTGAVTIALALFRHSRARRDDAEVRDGVSSPGHRWGRAARWAVLEKVALIIGTILATEVVAYGAVGALLTFLFTGAATLLLIALWRSSARRFDPYEAQLAFGEFARGAPIRAGVALIAGGVVARGDAPALLALAPVTVLMAGLHERRLAREGERRGMLRELSGLLRYAHPYTVAHMERVERVADQLGRELRLGSRHRARLTEAALLHDVGKIAVDERILEKPTTLTSEEFERVKLHAGFGAEIVAAADPRSPAVEWIRHHHERLDGSGYPQGLEGERIPFESRIIAVIDAFDAMTGRADDLHRRAYRDPLPSHEARLELRRGAGTQFDPKVVAAFERVLLADGLAGEAV